MPDEPTTPAVDTPAAVEESAPYAFPFEVPADLGTLDEAALAALQLQVREHATQYSGLSPAEQTDATLAALRACRDLAVTISNQVLANRDKADEVAALSADLADASDVFDATEEDDDDPPAEDPADADTGSDAEAANTTTAPVPAPVTAAARRPVVPRVRDVARNTRTPALPDARATASMRSVAHIAGYQSGQKLDAFADAAKALSAQLDRYASMSTSRARGTGTSTRFAGPKRPVTVYDPNDPGRTFAMKDYRRDNIVEIRREFPAELTVADGAKNGEAVALYAASERRLPGGNLIESTALAVKRGRSLTAAAGWCAPSDVIYDLCEMETLDGLIDVPELQTSRGGWQIPINGGPDFSTIYDSIGNAGDTHLTEDEVIADTVKVCTEIPCPDFEDVRLGVDYLCITGGLLQRRGYPEAVGRFTRGAMIALAHKVNAGVISAMVAGSGNISLIPADPYGDDAASALLAAVELAIEDIRYRTRASFTGTFEVVLPHWTLAAIRAGLSRRTGVAMLSVTNAQILDWFGERGAVPRLVYDWQDAWTGLPVGPGALVPLRRLPPTVDFMIYGAGTWVKAVQDVVALDTIYDSTLLSTNQYTAIFTEDGWAMLKMCPISRLYRVNVDTSGLVACCEGGIGS
jgi:hypothetical protein